MLREVSFMLVQSVYSKWQKTVQGSVKSNKAQSSKRYTKLALGAFQSFAN